MIIPKQIKELFRVLFLNFSSEPNSAYKQRIFKEVENDEERKDLEELFQSTEDYYKTHEEIEKSGNNAADYLFHYYMEKWDIENPQASERERKQAVSDYEEIIGKAAVFALDKLEEDGILFRKIEKAIKDCENEAEKESKEQELLSSACLFEEELIDEDFVADTNAEVNQNKEDLDSKSSDNDVQLIQK